MESQNIIIYDWLWALLYSIQRYVCHKSVFVFSHKKSKNGSVYILTFHPMKIFRTDSHIDGNNKKNTYLSPSVFGSLQANIDNVIDTPMKENQCDRRKIRYVYITTSNEK